MCTIIDNINKLQLNGMGSWPINTCVKYIGKKKTIYYYRIFKIIATSYLVYINRNKYYST